MQRRRSAIGARVRDAAMRYCDARRCVRCRAAMQRALQRSRAMAIPCQAVCDLLMQRVRVCVLQRL
jgi:hypothetical protein